MERLRKLRILRTFVIACYVLAVAAVGLSHQVLPTAASSPDLSAFVLPDGSLPGICAEGTNSSETGVPLGASKAFCDACLLTAAPGAVPSAGCWVPVRQALTSPAFSAPLGRLFVQALQHVPHLRGPPASA